MDKHTGTCNGCGAEDVTIYFGWSTRNSKLCERCDENRLKAAYKAKNKKPKPKKPVTQLKRSPISKKPSQSLSAMREMDWVVGLEIWAERPHYCIECGKFLPEDESGVPYKVYFSHVLSKGAHPELRFDPNNIVLHCQEDHRLWETSGKMKAMKTFALHSAYMQKNGFVLNEEV